MDLVTLVKNDKSSADSTGVTGQPLVSNGTSESSARNASRVSLKPLFRRYSFSIMCKLRSRRAGKQKKSACEWFVRDYAGHLTTADWRAEHVSLHGFSLACSSAPVETLSRWWRFQRFQRSHCASTRLNVRRCRQHRLVGTIRCTCPAHPIARHALRVHRIIGEQRHQVKSLAICERPALFGRCVALSVETAAVDSRRHLLRILQLHRLRVVLRRLRALLLQGWLQQS